MRTGSTTDQRQHVLGCLHEHARRLADELPAGLGRIRVCSGDVAIEVEWSRAALTAAVPAQLEPAATLVSVLGPTGPAGPGELADAGAGHVVAVSAPIVGTFYHAPEPGAEPYITVGKVIEAGATIGIVEAMKLLNPVTADTGGTVTRICVENGESVEFSQVLVEITPRQ
ncbi:MULTISPECIES: biotin/lipoyl-containing protein [unclassified Frankia]|uniref:acetyl-CoA carboxylase biotin carboxyl carrier protein n=1 Tax=unclassified Frankia TaxID=2632575 RepID=UPI001EF54038|nr:MULTISPECIES: biotin/lipoyl-containing protein [unclassified Frankia]